MRAKATLSDTALAQIAEELLPLLEAADIIKLYGEDETRSRILLLKRRGKVGK